MFDKLILILWSAVGTMFLIAIILCAGTYCLRNIKETFWGRDTVITSVRDTIYLPANYNVIDLYKSKYDSINRKLEFAQWELRDAVEEARKLDAFEQSPDSMARSLVRVREYLYYAKRSLGDTAYLGEIDNYDEGYSDGHDDGYDEGKENAKYEY